MTVPPAPHRDVANGASAGPAVPRIAYVVLLVAIALAFLPAERLPTFDSQKTLVLVVGAVVLTALAFRRRSPARDLDPLVLVPCALALLAWGVALVSGPVASLEGPLLAVGALGAMRLIAGDPDGGAAVRHVARAASIAATVAGAYALLQIAGLDPAPWGARRQAVATFGNTSFAAAFQATALPLSIYLIAASKGSRVDRALGGTAVLLGVAHLVVARSRIDALAAVAGVTVITALLLRRSGRRALGNGLLGVAGAGGLVLAALFVRAVGGTAPAWIGRADTVAVRAHIWSAFPELVTSTPLWLPQGRPFADLYPAVRAPEEYVLSLGRVVDTPHNDLLGIMVTLGIVGAVLAVALLVALVRRLNMGAASDGKFGIERAALLGGIAALVVSGLASSPLTHGATAALGALLWGAAIACCPSRGRTGSGETRAAHGLALVLVAVAVVPALHIVRSDGFLAAGRQAIEAGDLRRTVFAMDAAATADLRAFEPRHEVGAVLLSSGDAEAAVEALQDAVRVRPGHPVARSNLARALLVAGRPDEARRVLDAALADVPWHPELLATEGHIALADGRGADAVRAFEAAHERTPQEPRMAALLAEAHLLATPGGPAHERAIRALLVLLERNDLAQVNRSVRAMLGRDPTLLAPLAAAARRIADERADDAVALVVAAARTDLGENDPGFLEDAAQILRGADAIERATAFTGRALGLRAARALAAGDPERATRLARKAVERDHDPEHWLVMARALSRLGQLDAAVEAVGSAVATGPIDVAAVREDPALAPIARDEGLLLILKRAEERLEGIR